MQKELNLLRVFLTAVAVLLVVVLGFTRFGRRLGGALFRPFGGVSRGVSSVCGDIYSHFSPEPRHRREALERELREAQVAVLSAKELENQNRQLRMLLDVGAPVGWKAVGAAVQSRDPARWNWELVVGKGEDDGIREGDAVMFGKWMVGRVAEVNNSTAKVVLLGSGNCQMGVVVRHGSAESTGIYQGAGEALGDAFGSYVDFLPRDMLFQPGDGIFTAGQGGRLPPGLPVGTVANRMPCPEIIDNARSRVYVAPGISLDEIRFVVIFAERYVPQEGR